MTRRITRTLRPIVRALLERDNFIITAHEHPDPDSLGSMLALFFGLGQLGKKCRMVIADPIPPSYSWPGLDKIEIIPEGFQPGNDCVIVLDCEPARTGGIAPGLRNVNCLINIDHHEVNAGDGELCYINPSEAATSVIIYRLLKELNVKINREIATALYAGIVGDTGGFRHANTTSDILAIAAELVEYGAEPAQIAREIYACQPLSFMKLLGHALNNLKSDVQGKLVWMEVSFSDFQRFGADPTQNDQLIQYARMVDTAEIALLFRETQPQEVRVGFRAYSIDVAKLARFFGGGGHKLASGAKLNGELNEVVNNVLDVTRQYLIEGELHGRNS